MEDSVRILQEGRSTPRRWRKTVGRFHLVQTSMSSFVIVVFARMSYGGSILHHVRVRLQLDVYRNTQSWPSSK